METTRRTFLIFLAGISVSACGGPFDPFPEPDAPRSPFSRFRRQTLYRYNGMDYLIVEQNHGIGVFRGPPGSETLTRFRGNSDQVVRDGRLIGRIFPAYAFGSSVPLDIRVIRGGDSDVDKDEVYNARVVKINRSRLITPSPREAGLSSEGHGGDGGHGGHP